VFLGSDAVVAGARFVFIRSAADFEAAVRSAQYTHVVYYGHALDGENALLPAKGSKIDVPTLARALTGTSVAHFDILGCRSTSIAAQLATLRPEVKIGYLRSMTTLSRSGSALDAPILDRSFFLSMRRSHTATPVPF
jgi:hypothetical protein